MYYNNKYYKNYLGENGECHQVEIDKEEFTFWKNEAKALWGYLDFWGNFVPGILRTKLPIVEPQKGPGPV